MVIGAAELARNTIDYRSMSPEGISRVADSTIDTVKTHRDGAQPPLSWLATQASRPQPKLSTQSTNFLDRLTGELLSRVNLNTLTPEGLMNIFQTAHEEIKQEEMRRAHEASWALEQMNLRSNADKVDIHAAPTTVESRTWWHRFHR